MPTLLSLAYDGRDLRGCPVVAGRRTVGGELQAALARLGVAEAVELVSRTDAGVHARGQVGVVASETRPASWWVRGLDRHLPADLRCQGAAVVDAMPRVVAKTYAYTLDLAPHGDPFAAHRAWRVPVDPDVVSGLVWRLEGTRDLRAFRRRGETRVDLVRTVHRAEVVREGHRLVIRLTGDGFVYRAVRSLVGAVVAVARGTCAEADLERALAGEVTAAARQQAPARGLCLEAVRLEPAVDWVDGPSAGG